MWQFSYPRDEWPRYLWRVIHVGTNTVAHPDDPLQRKIIADAAIDTLQRFHMIRPNHQYPLGCDILLALVDSTARQDPATASPFPFLDMMANHVDWSNQSRTWFLSTFSDGGHAQNWAQQRRRWAQDRQRNDDVTVYKIDTTLLPPSARLFDMDTLKVLFRLKDQLKYKYEDEVLVFGRIPDRAVVDVFKLGEDDECNLGIFFSAGKRPGGKLDENLDDDQVQLRAQILGASKVEAKSGDRVSVADGMGISERMFLIPVAVARHFGWKESDGEERVEEEEEVVVVVEVEEEFYEEKEQEVVEVVKEVVEVQVEDGVKGKDNQRAGEGEANEEQDEGEGEDEMAQLIGRLAISA